MLSKNRCIVLSKLKYGDNDLIVKCYTSQRGILSYILKGVLRSKKGNAKLVYFQPMSLLTIEESYKPNRSLHTIKDVKPYFIFNSLHTNVYKSSIVLFLSEFLSLVLKEEEKNQDLFSFIETAMQYLDEEKDYANFHLLFILKLTRYLGFQPDIQNIENSYFNLESGTFEQNESGEHSISSGNLTLLKRLLGMNFDALNTIKINSEQRQSFLNMLLFYFELHLDGFRKPKSLQVLNDVFH